MNRHSFISNTWVKAAPGEIDQLPEDIVSGEYYILKGRRIETVSGVLDWAEYFEHNNRVVAKDVIGAIEISTVFLGIDHSFGFGAPILFETMIFGGGHDQEMWRCSTYAQAEAQHKRALEFV